MQPNGQTITERLVTQYECLVLHAPTRSAWLQCLLSLRENSTGRLERLAANHSKTHGAGRLCEIQSAPGPRTSCRVSSKSHHVAPITLGFYFLDYLTGCEVYSRCSPVPRAVAGTEKVPRY